MAYTQCKGELEFMTTEVIAKKKYACWYLEGEGERTKFTLRILISQPSNGLNRSTKMV